MPISVPEAFEELEIVRIRIVEDERPRAPSDPLQCVCNNVGHEYRLRTMPSQIGDPIEMPDTTDGVERAADDVRAGTCDRLDPFRGILEEPIRLCPGIR